MIVLPAIVQTMVTASVTRAEVLSGVMDSTVLALTEGKVVILNGILKFELA